VLRKGVRMVAKHPDVGSRRFSFRRAERSNGAVCLTPSVDYANPEHQLYPYDVHAFGHS